MTFSLGLMLPSLNKAPSSGQRVLPSLSTSSAFDKLDHNHDGVIDRDEWKEGVEKGLLQRHPNHRNSDPDADLDAIICGRCRDWKLARAPQCPWP